MPAKKISIEKAKADKLFYVVANAVVYRESDGKCLILKRSEREIVHPGLYGVVGGKLEWNDMPIDAPDHINGDILDYHDMIEKLLIREAREEAGIELHPEIEYMHSKVFIRPDGIPVMFIKFTAKYKSGNIVLEEGAFSDFAWVNGEEVKEYTCIDGIADEVSHAITMWQK